MLMVCAAACGSDRPPFVPTQPPVVIPPVEDPPPPPPPPTLAVTRIMAFGDSLTEGDPPTLGQIRLRPAHDPSTPGGQKSYPYKLHALLSATYTPQKIEVFNEGLGGEPVAHSSAKDRYLAALARHKPQVVLMMHGTNDLLSSAPQNAIVNAIEELIELSPARGVQRVFLASLPPNFRSPAREQLSDYNNRLRILAPATGSIFVDIFPNIDTATMMAPDGLHINESGNQRIAEVFFAALKAAYHRDPPP